MAADTKQNKINLKSRLTVGLSRAEKKPKPVFIPAVPVLSMVKDEAKQKKKFRILRLLFFILFFLIIALAVYDFIGDFYGDGGLAKNGQSVKLPQDNNPVKFNNEEYRLPEKNNPGGLNLIFLADQYSSWEEFEADISGLMTELKTIEPWQSYNSFNLFKINPKQTGLCYVKTKDERKPVLRCLSSINNYLVNLPLTSFRLIVLSRQEFQSWANVTRYENSGIFFSAPQVLKEKTDQKVHALLLAHLLAHAFGVKDEEIFVLAQAGGAPHTPDGPNCAPDAATAQNWWGDLAKKNPAVGYFKGCCGDGNYIKPTQSSIMNLNTGDPVVYNYGPVSEQYLKKILDYCFTEKSYSASADPDFFELYPEFKQCLNQ